MSARTAAAWVLEYAPGRSVAFAAQSALSLVESPRYTYVPGAPRHCLGLMRWEGQAIALLDLGAMFGAGEACPAAASHALVVAWKDGAASGLGAVAAPFLARLVEVSDEQQCAPARDKAALAGVALAWFEHERQPVPVADAARLFA